MSYLNTKDYLVYTYARYYYQPTLEEKYEHLRTYGEKLLVSRKEWRDKAVLLEEQLEQTQIQKAAQVLLLEKELKEERAKPVVQVSVLEEERTKSAAQILLLEKELDEERLSASAKIALLKKKSEKRRIKTAAQVLVLEQKLEKRKVKAAAQIGLLEKELEEERIKPASVVSSFERIAPNDYADTLQEQNPCVCCLSNKPCYLFLGCGHLCVCNGCSEAFKKNCVCPLCNQKSDITFVYQ